MLKLLALGALGYAGYKYYAKNRERFGRSAKEDGHLAVAGGPISEKASVRHTPPA